MQTLLSNEPENRLYEDYAFYRQWNEVIERKNVCRPSWKNCADAVSGTPNVYAVFSEKICALVLSASVSSSTKQFAYQCGTKDQTHTQNLSQSNRLFQNKCRKNHGSHRIDITED